MKPNWEQIAIARGLNMPPEEIARIVPLMNALEAGFRPLLERLRYDMEPSTILSLQALTGR